MGHPLPRAAVKTGPIARSRCRRLLVCLSRDIPTHSATLVVLRLVAERGDHQPQYTTKGWLAKGWREHVATPREKIAIERARFGQSWLVRRLYYPTTQAGLTRPLSLSGPSGPPPYPRAIARRFSGVAAVTVFSPTFFLHWSVGVLSPELTGERQELLNGSSWEQSGDGDGSHREISLSTSRDTPEHSATHPFGNSCRSPISSGERRPPTLLERNGQSIERTPRWHARKSPSKEPEFGKVGSFGPTSSLQLRQGRQLEFRHRGLHGSLPMEHRATIFSLRGCCRRRSLQLLAILFR